VLGEFFPGHDRRYPESGETSGNHKSSTAGAR
jgi:hypothetical protein